MAIEKDTPRLSVMWELTNRCNERCIHCYVDQSDGIGIMDADKVIEEIKKFNPWELIITGGDPFMRKDASKIILKLAKTFPDINMRVLTNGLLISANENIQKEILNLPRDRVSFHISIYGHNPELHDMITNVPGSFESSRKAIDFLKSCGFEVCASFMLLNQNFEYRHEILKFINDNGLKYDTNAVVLPALKDNKILHGKEVRITKEQFRQAITEEDFKILAGSYMLPNPENVSCSRKVLISPDGSVSTCHMESFYKSYLGDSLDMGTMLSKLSEFKDLKMKECSSCIAKDHCFKCSVFMLTDSQDSDYCEKAKISYEAIKDNPLFKK